MNWENIKFDVRNQLGGKECMFLGCVMVELDHQVKGKFEFEVGVYAVFREGARIGQGLAWQDPILGERVIIEGSREPDEPREKPSEAVARFHRCG